MDKKTFAAALIYSFFAFSAFTMLGSAQLSTGDSNTSAQPLIFVLKAENDGLPMDYSNPSPIVYSETGNATLWVRVLMPYEVYNADLKGTIMWLGGYLTSVSYAASWHDSQTILYKNTSNNGIGALNCTLTNIPYGEHQLQVNASCVVFILDQYSPLSSHPLCETSEKSLNFTVAPLPTTTSTRSPPLTQTSTPSIAPTQQPMLKVIDTTKLRNFGGFYGAVYDSGTDEVYVSNVDFNLVSVISASSRTEVVEIAVGSQPLGVAYNSGKGEIFVANYASNSVSVISDINHAVIATISVGRHPTALAYDSERGEVFVVNRDDNTVSVISDITNRVVATIPVGKTPYGIAYSPTGKLYVTNHGDNTVSVISDGTNTVAATVQVGINPYHAVYDSAKGEIFVTNNNSSSVSVLSDSTDTVVANISVGNSPMGLTYDSARRLVFVGNYGDNSVSVISDETNTVIQTIASQQQPFALAYDSTHKQIFVAHMESWSVSVISDSSEPTSSPAATVTASSSATPFPSTSSTPPEGDGRFNFVAKITAAAIIAVISIAAIAYFKKRKVRT